MTLKSKRRLAICLAAIVGLCLSPSNRLKCQAFVTSTPATGRGSTGTTSAHPVSRGCASTRTRSTIRSRDSTTSRLYSAVEDVERSTVVGDKGWTSSSSSSREILPLSRIDPEIFLFGSTASGAVSAAPTAADPAAHIAAAVVDNPVAVPAEQPVLSSKSPEEIGREGGRIKKNRRKAGKAPVVVEGDDLANTPKMIALVWSSLALNALYLLQAFLAVGSPVEALGTAAAGAFVGYVIADLWSGLLHWSLDNYGSGDTPAFGAIIESFQGHHASPWTITHRPFENNVHKVTYAALPLLALLRLADPGLFGVALGVAFLYGSLMSNEFHKYSHMLDPPPVAKALQGMGLSISRKQHGRHHSGTFDEKYCLVSGICNGIMDDFRVFRFLERVVYQTNGMEPIAWRLDPSLKEVALSTGWWPFELAHVEASAAAEDAEAGQSA